MEYNCRDIEKRWRETWAQEGTYHAQTGSDKPKYYVLNMFPYPSGAGLHVGHPLGYIASDIFARYKRLCGFNVLNPMGYDAYGLPAEQYAIQTGQHPAVTTQQNITRYREQLDKIGFSFDWSREVRTCEPSYYRWTQWAFGKMFQSFYDNAAQKARPISELVAHFEAQGTEGLDVAETEALQFTAAEWKAMNEVEQQQTLMNYRIAYIGETMVNWCPALGTVLANDEVVDGVSERGGHPVVQQKMKQWCLRVSAYAGRMLDSLEHLDWSDSLKETQRNWIGRSQGTEMQFRVKDSDLTFTIFTTRADTIFGVTFMVLAPESELVAQLTTDAQRAEVEAYVAATAKRTERERISDRKVSGVFSELAAASEAGYIPQLLGRENLLSYNARREICEGISAIIAPPTAGFIVLVAGATVGLIVPVLLFGAATISYATLPSVEMETKTEQRETAQHGFIHRMFDGIQYMFSGAPQRLILVYTFFLAAATASYSLIIIYRLYEELTFEASVVGMIMACSGIGGIVAALIIDRFLSFENTRGMLLVANVVSLLGIPLVTVSNNPVVLGALLFILDVGWASAFIFSNNLRDCITPNELLGRASSLDGAVFGLGTLYSMGAVALMLDHLGSFNAALVVSIPAVLCLIYTLVHYKQFKVFNIVEQ